MRLPIRTLLLALVLVQPLGAQIIPLKSTGTPRGDQFLFLPGWNLGRAELQVASGDPLMDPFRNPAFAPTGPTLRLTTSPVIYHNTLGTVGGTTLPVSVLVQHAGWFGALAYASQELDDDPLEVLVHPSQLNGEGVTDGDRKNTYALGSLGHRFASGTSLGVQVQRGHLGILDGTRRLYPESLGVLQDGEWTGWSVGVAQELGSDRLLEATYRRTRTEMENEVTRWRWMPASGGTLQDAEVFTQHDRDASRTMQGRLRYTEPLESVGLRFGVALGALDRTQDATPRYDLAMYPRDPGSARVYEVSLGAETMGHDPLLAWELSLQPGSSDTRGLADSTFVTPSGATVEPGDPATDSHFTFRNWRLAGGVQLPVGPGHVQIGLALHRYHVTLAQEDHLFERMREASEKWMELLPSAGARVALGPVDVGYAVRVVAKGAAPCRRFSFRPQCQGEEELFWDTDIIVGPTTPAHIPDFRVTTHQFTVGWRIGG